jgi:hypothetical protein
MENKKAMGWVCYAMIHWFHFHSCCYDTRIVVISAESYGESFTEIYNIFYFSDSPLFEEQKRQGMELFAQKGGGSLAEYVYTVFPQLNGSINEKHVEIISSY